MSLRDEPRRLRKIAKGTQAAAERMTDPLGRAMMVIFAEAYVRLAEHTERKLTPRQHRRPRGSARA